VKYLEECWVYRAKKKPLESILPKSTLADANKGRKIEFLKKFIIILSQKYGFILSDSRIQDALKKNVKIVDSTTMFVLKIY
jgi:hypothetical protein